MVDTTGHDHTLAKGRVKSIIKDETGDRVTSEAVVFMQAMAEAYIVEMAREAKVVKDQSERKTLQEGDFRAAEKLRRLSCGKK